MADTKFKAGQPKIGGRKAGTPNKKTVEFQELLASKDFSPGEELIYIYREQMKIFEARKLKGNMAGCLLALEDAQMTANNICQYVYPKKKAIEHTGEVGIKTFADFMSAAKGHKAAK